MEDKQTGVYAIINRTNGKRYIGSTVTPIYRRWAHHKTRLRQGRHVDPNLQADWTRLGEEAFEFVVIEVVDEIDRITIREQYHIRKGLEKDPTKIYNTNDKVTRPKTNAEHDAGSTRFRTSGKDRYGG